MVTGLSALAAPVVAQAPTYTTFEGLTTGVSIDGQAGWTSTNPGWDEEVVDDGGDFKWRVSNAVTGGSFSDMPIAPPSDLYAGETGSMHAFDAAAAVTDSFYGSFVIESVGGAVQPGLDITISPSDSSGKRQSFLSVEDNGGAGLEIDFFDSQANHPVTNPDGGFVQTVVATGLDRSVPHTVSFLIEFVDGNIIDSGTGEVFGNDIVKIFVDGDLVHTGTTWESYYWTTTEGQVPPTTQAIDTLLFRISTGPEPSVMGAGYYIDDVFVSTLCPDSVQGFETGIEGWDVFSSSVFYPTQVPSGTDGITSASGSFHATASATAGQVPAGNWGGYSGYCECSSSSCSQGEFPAHGYETSIDVYFDMDGGWADDTRFEFTSAINTPEGPHRRDFVMSAGFYSAADPTLPGTGQDRFIVSASNNSMQPPANPGNDPIFVTLEGWYTLHHRFYRTPFNTLAVDMTLIDPVGTDVHVWTRNNPADVIGLTVGGNRYGWFATNQFDNLHFDNATRTTVVAEADLQLTLADCQDDADPIEPGFQVEVQLEMLNLTSVASGFQAFLEYDMSTFAYRGDLSSYESSPFPLHLSPINQTDDGALELDGSENFGGTGTTADALLATLVFDVLPAAACSPVDALTFAPPATLESTLSFASVPLDTTLIDPAAYTLDDTPPVLSPCPSDITVIAEASSLGGCGGATVFFTDPTATDDCDVAPTVVCTPASGSLFSVGVHTITCVATDACGNESTCTFEIEVLPVNEIDVQVELVGVNAPVSRCIYFQAVDDCSTTTSQLLSFVDHDGDDPNENGIVDVTEGGSDTPSTPVRAIDTITVDCGDYTSLCAKDEQHTLWASTPTTLTARGTYSSSGVLSLEGGDATNDGNVDINDVTLFIAQFGSFSAGGACPYDGFTLDTDFSNDGEIGAEDYSFLVDNWLTLSSCACSVPLVASTTRQADDRISKRADLNGDGVINWIDVAILEERNGLSRDLSTRMREGR